MEDDNIDNNKFKEEVQQLIQYTEGKISLINVN